jgi:hypothetical protein
MGSSRASGAATPPQLVLGFGSLLIEGAIHTGIARPAMS